MGFFNVKKWLRGDCEFFDYGDIIKTKKMQPTGDKCQCSDAATDKKLQKVCDQRMDDANLCRVHHTCTDMQPGSQHAGHTMKLSPQILF